jgi:hypothetical protein
VLVYGNELWTVRKANGKILASEIKFMSTTGYTLLDHK